MVTQNLYISFTWKLVFLVTKIIILWSWFSLVKAKMMSHSADPMRIRKKITNQKQLTLPKTPCQWMVNRIKGTLSHYSSFTDCRLALRLQWITIVQTFTSNLWCPRWKFRFLRFWTKKRFLYNNDVFSFDLHAPLCFYTFRLSHIAILVMWLIIVTDQLLTVFNNVGESCWPSKSALEVL